MLRRNFQILVFASQILIIGVIAVQYFTESSLPPELLGYLNEHQTILIPDTQAIVELVTDVPFLVQRLLGVIAAVGLILFKGWGKSVFLIYLATELVLTVLTGPHVSTGWTAFFGYVASLMEGIILALIYVSPVRKMF